MSDKNVMYATDRLTAKNKSPLKCLQRTPVELKMYFFYFLTTTFSLYI